MSYYITSAVFTEMFRMEPVGNIDANTRGDGSVLTVY